MTSFVIVRKDSYHDSVLLMRISRDLKTLDRIEDAVVAMGTPHNRDLLRRSGFDDPSLAAAGPNDLVIAVKGNRVDAAAVEAAIEKSLRSDESTADDETRPTTLSAAVRAHPDTNLVLISVPGEYAAEEARRALALDRHVMIFSSNVSIEEEVALKEDAVSRGLLCMGPDCGTAIVNGKPLAFANVVRRGSIGVVGAAGTGIQEVASCIHRLGGGVSQAIGVGGRDLSDTVGGMMTLLAIDALAADPGTDVIVVVSKPPSPVVSERVVDALARSSKRSVVHFVGASIRSGTAGAPTQDEAAAPMRFSPGAARPVLFADSLADAAEIACEQAGLRLPSGGGLPGAPLSGDRPDTGAPSGTAQSASAIPELPPRLAAGAKLCALFCGGTLGHEALAILTRAGIEVRSNLHKAGPLRISGIEPAAGHVLLDLGDEIFTQGRPHPMIEPVLRNERLAIEIADPRAGLLLFDVVLGYGSHPDPAGILVRGVEQARQAAREQNRSILAIASVTGTEDDPQDYRAQVRRLEEAGIVVAPDNRAAAQLAASLLKQLG